LRRRVRVHGLAARADVRGARSAERERQELLLGVSMKGRVGPRPLDGKGRFAMARRSVLSVLVLSGASLVVVTGEGCSSDPTWASGDVPPGTDQGDAAASADGSAGDAGD